MLKVLPCLLALLLCWVHAGLAGVIPGFEPVWEKYSRSSAIQSSPRPLVSSKDKISYSIGVAVGKEFKKQSFRGNFLLMEQGLKDVLKNDFSRLSEDESREVLDAFQKMKASDPAVQLDKKTLDNVSYSLGMKMGRDFKEQGIDVDAAIIRQAITDIDNDKPLLLTEEQIKEAMDSFQKEYSVKKESVAKVEGLNNRKYGDAFLSENARKPGVVVLPSGLQYKVLNQGAGKKPTTESKVTVNYVGTSVDGKEFDSSYKRGKPATFPVNGVIAGWTEALQLMREGTKWQVFIPANLAYGERGAGKVIGPNATLIFEIELISVD